jgi:hypothetical protein
MPPLSRHVVMPQLVGFLDSYPNLRIEFHPTQDTRAIQSENIDVLLHVGEPPPSRLIARKLGQGRPAAYASPAYIARHGELKDPGELRAHRCLAFKPDWLTQPYVRWTFTKGARTKTIKINPAIVTSDREALLVGAASSAGVIFMACFDPGLIASKQLIRLFPDWSCKPSFNIYALYRDKSVKVSGVASFLSFSVLSGILTGMSTPSFMLGASTRNDRMVEAYFTMVLLGKSPEAGAGKANYSEVSPMSGPVPSWPPAQWPSRRKYRLGCPGNAQIRRRAIGIDLGQTPKAQAIRPTRARPNVISRIVDNTTDGDSPGRVGVVATASTGLWNCTTKAANWHCRRAAARSRCQPEHLRDRPCCLWPLVRRHQLRTGLGEMSCSENKVTGADLTNIGAYELSGLGREFCEYQLQIVDRLCVRTTVLICAPDMDPNVCGTFRNTIVQPNG